MKRITDKTMHVRLVRKRDARLHLAVDLVPPGSMPGKGHRITPRAIRLANALALEELLHAGVFSSLNDAIEKLGISRGIVQRLLQMLNTPPEEMVAILNSRY